MVGNDLCEDLARNTQQGDTVVVVTVRLTALLVNGHKLLCPVTGNRHLCPNGGEDRGQPMDRGLPAKLEHFTRDPIWAWGLPIVHLGDSSANSLFCDGTAQLLIIIRAAVL